MKSHRLARVSEVIREVAAETILFGIRDPRVKNVTVTRAETSADLQHAKVYVSIMGSEAEQRRTLRALQNAAGFVQSKLSDRMASRFLPQLLFVIDEGVKKSLEIARILAEERAKGGLGPAEDVAAGGDAVGGAAGDVDDDGDEDDDGDDETADDKAGRGDRPAAGL